MADMQQITERNLTTSPFLKLPGELRNKIYHLTLGGNTWHITDDEEVSNTVPQADRNDHRDLVRVCRQIYTETRILPWSLGTFASLDPQYLRRWLVKFPTNCRRAIKSVILCTQDPAHGFKSIPVSRQGKPEWVARGALGFQDFPGLQGVQVQAYTGSWSAEKWIEALKREGARGDVWVTIVRV